MSADNADGKQCPHHPAMSPAPFGGCYSCQYNRVVGSPVSSNPSNSSLVIGEELYCWLLSK